MGSKAPKPQPLPTPDQLRPLVDLQAQYNRIGYETPFGSQNYRTNPDGTYTMVTDIGPEGRQLVGRAVGLGMTDTANQQVPPQISAIANALAGRVGSRFGLQPGEQFSLGSAPNRPAAKPEQMQQPPPQLPPMQPPPQLPPMQPPPQLPPMQPPEQRVPTQISGQWLEPQANYGNRFGRGTIDNRVMQK